MKKINQKATQFEDQIFLYFEKYIFIFTFQVAAM